MTALRKIRAALIMMSILAISGLGLTANASVTPQPTNGVEAPQVPHTTVNLCVYGSPAGSGQPCANEWGGNGANGNPINAYHYITGINEYWHYHLIDPCNSSYTVTHTCPFPVGSGMNDAEFGNNIVQIMGPHYECMATDGNGRAVNGNCGNSVDGQGESTGVTMILDGGPNHVNCLYNNFCPIQNLHWSAVYGNLRHICPNGLADGVPINLFYAQGSCSNANLLWFNYNY